MAAVYNPSGTENSTARLPASIPRTSPGFPEPTRASAGTTGTTARKVPAQGITDINRNGRKFIVVSGYGRGQADYADCGVRLSFADVTDMARVRYRHVLLVDPDYRTFTGMHGGRHRLPLRGDPRRLLSYAPGLRQGLVSFDLIDLPCA